MKKKIIIGVISAIILFTIFKLIPSKELKELETNFDLDRPILLEKNGLYGYINQDGKEITDFRYTHATNFTGEFGVVKYKDGEKYIQAIINEKGKLLKSVELESNYSNKILYYEEAESFIIDGKLFNKNLKQVSKDKMEVSHLRLEYFEYKIEETKELGIINNKGKVLYSIKSSELNFTMSESEYNDELYAFVSDNEQGNIISLKTGKIIKTIKDLKKNKVRVYSNNIFEIKTEEKSEYLYIENNKIKHSEVADSVEFYMENVLEIDYGYNYESLGKNARYYYYNLKTKKTYKEAPYEEKVKTIVDPFVEFSGYQTESCESGYTVTKNNKPYLPCGYDRIIELDLELFKYINLKTGKSPIILKKENEIHIVNLKTKKSIYKFKATDLYDISTYLETVFVLDGDYSDSSKEETIIYNLLTGKSKSFKTNRPIIRTNYLIVESDTKTEYYNLDFKKIYELKKN